MSLGPTFKMEFFFTWWTTYFWSKCWDQGGYQWIIRLLAIWNTLMYPRVDQAFFSQKKLLMNCVHQGAPGCIYKVGVVWFLKAFKKHTRSQFTTSTLWTNPGTPRHTLTPSLYCCIHLNTNIPKTFKKVCMLSLVKRSSLGAPECARERQVSFVGCGF